MSRQRLAPFNAHHVKKPGPTRAETEYIACLFLTAVSNKDCHDTIPWLEMNDAWQPHRHARNDHILVLRPSIRSMRHHALKDLMLTDVLFWGPTVKSNPTETTHAPPIRWAAFSLNPSTGRCERREVVKSETYREGP